MLVGLGMRAERGSQHQAIGGATAPHHTTHTSSNLLGMKAWWNTASATSSSAVRSGRLHVHAHSSSMQHMYNAIHPFIHACTPSKRSKHAITSDHALHAYLLTWSSAQKPHSPSLPPSFPRALSQCVQCPIPHSPPPSLSLPLHLAAASISLSSSPSNDCSVMAGSVAKSNSSRTVKVATPATCRRHPWCAFSEYMLPSHSSPASTTTIQRTLSPEIVIDVLAVFSQEVQGLGVVEVHSLAYINNVQLSLR